MYVVALGKADGANPTRTILKESVLLAVSTANIE